MMKKLTTKTYIAYVLILCVFTVLSVKAQTETLIPDPNFEQQLINQGHDSGPIDGKVLTANIDTLTFLSISGGGVSDLTGIEDFISLTFLNVSGTNVTSLDVTSLTNLTRLQADLNDLTSLNVTGLSQLDYLSCFSNNLTTVDLTGLTSLATLYIYFNPLISLDLSPATELIELRASDTGLSSLDLSANTKLEKIESSNNNLTIIDFTNNPLMKSMFIRANQLSDIVGLSGLTNLDFAGINDNNLTALDFSQNTNLTLLQINGNDLQSLNLKNGNNVNMSVDILDNPNLTCVAVDDITYSTTNWTTKDAQTSYDTDCAPGIMIYAKKAGSTSAPRIHVWPNEPESNTSNWPNNLQFMTVSSTYPDYYEYEVKNGQTTVNTLFIFDGVQTPDQMTITDNTWFSISSGNVVDRTTIDPNIIVPGIKIYAKKEGVTNAPQIHAWPNITTWGSLPNMTASVAYPDYFEFETPSNTATVSTLFIFDGVQTPDQINITEDTWFDVASDGTVSSTTTPPVPPTTPVLTVTPSANFEADTTQSITASATLGATIYYTTSTDWQDPVDPTDASTLYTGSVDITVSTKFKFIAYNGVHTSTIESREYTFPVIPVLTVSPSATYEEGTVQTITATSTLGAPIHYTVSFDGTAPPVPTTSSPIFSGSEFVSQTATYNFRAFNGANASFMATTTYTFVPPVTGIKIYAKKDGVTNAPRIHVWPNEVESDTSDWPNNLQFMTTSSTYTDYFEYEIKNGQTTVNTLFIFDGVQTPDQMNITQDTWFSIASNGTVSSTTTPPSNPLAPVTSSSEDGTFIEGTSQNIVATATLGASIYYTFSTTGVPVDPDFNSTLYTGPITVTDDVTYKFISYSSGFSSNIATTSYAFEPEPTAIKVYVKRDSSNLIPYIHAWPGITSWSTKPQMQVSSTYSGYYEYEAPSNVTTLNCLFVYYLNNQNNGTEDYKSADQTGPGENGITQDTWFTIDSSGNVTSTTTPPSASRPSIVEELGFETPELVVAPSPASSYIDVRYPYFENTTGVIEIYNMSGAMVLSKEFQSQEQLEERVDISRLDNGVHILKIQSGMNQETLKFSIIR